MVTGPEREATAWAFPAALIVATAELLDCHVAVAPGTESPPWSTTFALNWALSPISIAVSTGVTTIAVGPRTRTRTDVTAGVRRAVMNAVPELLARTSPVVLTDATSVSLDSHVGVTPVIGRFCASYAVACICTVWPGETRVSAGPTTM